MLSFGLVFVSEVRRRFEHLLNVSPICLHSFTRVPCYRIMLCRSLLSVPAHSALQVVGVTRFLVALRSGESARFL